MRVTIERAQLLKSLNHVQSVVERRNTIPILSNVLLNASGGGVAFVGNSFLSHMPEYGELQSEFFRLLFKKKTLHLGELLARSKLPFMVFPNQKMRINLLITNLLGDPEMKVRLDE